MTTNADTTKPIETKPADAPTTTPPPSTVPARVPTESRIPVRMGVSPTTLDEAWRLSQNLAASELVPKQFRGHPADVLTAIQLAMEIGLAPMQGLQSIAVINGRATVWGDAMLAIIMSSPLYEDHDEYFEVNGQRRDGLVADDWKHDTTCAVFYVKRHSKATPVVSRFTVADAKKASLLQKEGPWQQYPARMLKMRARGFGLRDAFPDLLRGIRIAEEVYDLPDDNTPPAPAREVRRASESRGDLHAFGIDRTPATRAADAPELIGPLAVLDVQPFLGGFTLKLADGTLVDGIEMTDAAELEKVKGTPHRYTFTCERLSGGNLQLKSFAIAD